MLVVEENFINVVRFSENLKYQKDEGSLPNAIELKNIFVPCRYFYSISREIFSISSILTEILSVDKKIFVNFTFTSV